MRLILSLAAAAAGFLLAGQALAAAPAIPPADAAAMRGHTHTVDKVQRYNNASAMIRRAEASNPAFKTEEDRAGDEPGATIADISAKLKRHPNLAAYYHKAGLTDQDAILIPLVAMNAAMAASMPAVAAKLPVTPEQIAFAKAHKQELAALGGE